MGVTVRSMTAKELFSLRDWSAFEAEYMALAYPEMKGPGVLQDYYERVTAPGMPGRLLVAMNNWSIVGVACFFVERSPHTGVKTALVDALYTSNDAPEGAGARLLLALRRAARAAGAKVVLFSAQTGSRFDNMLAGLKGARHAQNIYILKA